MTGYWGGSPCRGTLYSVSDDKPLDEPVVVVAYEAAWAEQAGQAVQELTAALGDLVGDVEHIGSTAVPGLAAKPVLDFAAAVKPQEHARAAALLAQHGFEDLGEAGVPGRRYLRRRLPPPAINVHLMAPGGALWLDNLVLRDHLRSSPDDAAAYEAGKRAAAAEHTSLLSYSTAKAELVQALLTAARAATLGRQESDAELQSGDVVASPAGGGGPSGRDRRSPEHPAR